MACARSDELDQTLQLEAIYYSAPIPRSLAALVTLGVVFDRVHFSNVHLPTENFDQKELKAEIDRIAALNRNDPETSELLSMMRFVEHAKTLEGLCVFDRKTDDPLGNDDAPYQLVNAIYQEIHGPPKDNRIPVFQSLHHKSIPGSSEHITYPGAFFYPAGAITRSTQIGIPLLNDLEGLPVPGTVATDFVKDAKSLSAFIALETIGVALPEISLLHPKDLMEFRDDNRVALRAFRRSMLRYAGQWQKNLAVANADELREATTFMVQTEIVPVLDELRQSMNDPARPWHKRAIDAVRVVPTIAAACFGMPPKAVVAKVLLEFAPQFFNELSAKGDKEEALRRSGLYYLLRLQAKKSA